MDSSSEENLPSDGETTKQVQSKKNPKVTTAMFYKRGSAARHAASTAPPPSRSHSPGHAHGDDDDDDDDLQSEMDIVHGSPILQGAAADMSIADEVPIDFLCDDDVSSPAQEDLRADTPLLYSAPESPSSSPSGVAVVDAPSHSSAATIISPPASKSHPLPENPTPPIQPTASSSRRSKVWDYFYTIGDGKRAKCKQCGKEVSRGKVVGHLTNASMNSHLRTNHKALLLQEESGLSVSPTPYKGSSSSASAGSSHSATTTTPRSDNTDKRQGGQVVVPPKPNQSTLEQFSGFHSRGISRQQSRKITRLIGELIAVGGAPFNIVDGEPFKRLMQAVAPQYVVPSRTTFSRTIVPSLYTSCVQLLKEELRKAVGQSVHLTTDLWSAPSGQHAFLSLTAHWWQPSVIDPAQTIPGPRRTTGTGVVESNQGHRTFLLHAEVMDEKHTAENILQALKKMVAEWIGEGEQAKSQPRMGFVVTDGAKNMLRALKEGKFVGVRCAAHVLHLVVKLAIDESSSDSDAKLPAILDACRKIAGHFHHSVKDTEIFRQEQAKVGLPQHRLKIDIANRWNSTLEMLERILEQQKAIHAMSREYSIGVTRPLSKEEWTIIAQVVTVLSPFRSVTENLSRENASLAQVLPFFTHLQTKMDALLNNQVPLAGGHLLPDVASLVCKINAQMHRRIKEVTESCPELMFASMCDPRIKGQLALQANSLTTWRDKLINRVCDLQRQLRVHSPEEQDDDDEEEEDPESTQLPSTSVPTTAAHSSRADKFWAETLQCIVGPTQQPSRIPRDKVAANVTTYLSEPHLLHTEDPLKYWDERRAIWPTLSMVAQELLSCPPTSVPSERVFSVTGNILSPLRSQLSPRLMEQMAFLKVNLPKLGYPALSFETN